jgi:hypothetical protein
MLSGYTKRPIEKSAAPEDLRCRQGKPQTPTEGPGLDLT